MSTFGYGSYQVFESFIFGFWVNWLGGAYKRAILTPLRLLRTVQFRCPLLNFRYRHIFIIFVKLTLDAEIHTANLRFVKLIEV